MPGILIFTVSAHGEGISWQAPLFSFNSLGIKTE
jgi:hypothetical protein